MTGRFLVVSVAQRAEVAMAVKLGVGSIDVAAYIDGRRLGDGMSDLAIRPDDDIFANQV